jgi:lysozyme
MASNFRSLLHAWHRINLRFHWYPIYLVLVFLASLVLRHDARHYKVQGVDVSRYQRTVNWKQLQQEGNVQFAFIKATEGTSYRDPYFDQNWVAAKEAGVIRGAYHFYLPYKSALWQARHFIKTVPLRPGDLPPVLDIENVSKVDKAILLEQVGIWLEEVEKHYGIQPIIYASLDLYRRHLREAFPAHLVWIARYSRRQPPTKLHWRFWQYSDQMQLPGINGNVDGNVFVGNYWQLKQLCL